MSTGGWDVVSLVDMDLINKALGLAADKVVTRFAYRESHMRILGDFGPWQIVPGGSMQKLHVDLPITRGEMRVIGAKSVRYDLSGLTLRVEFSLRLLPPSSETGTQDLVFDLDRSDMLGAERPLNVVDLFDPEGRIANDDTRVLSVSLAACLKEHADNISFVFASVVNTAGLAMPNLDWANMETRDNGHYLAITGALNPMPPDLSADTIDPILIAPGMRAALAISGRALCEKIVAPSMNQTFTPKNRFQAKGEIIRLTNPVELRPQKADGYTLRPLLRMLSMQKITTGFDMQVHADTGVDGFAVKLVTDMKLKLKFVADQAKGSITLRLDGDPDARTIAIGQGFWGGLITFIANIVLLFVQDRIKALATGIASSTVTINAPGNHLVSWTGVETFKATLLRTDGYIYLADV